jgi:hypothetical protein
MNLSRYCKDAIYLLRVAPFTMKKHKKIQPELLNFTV